LLGDIGVVAPQLFIRAPAPLLGTGT